MFRGFNVALRRLAVAAFALAAVGAGAPALAKDFAVKDFTITVWSGGTSDPEHYRVDNIKLAAEQLQREAQAEGKDLKIKVDARVFNDWDSFKQAFTLAAQSKTGPNIVVSGHEDIAAWSQAGLLRPVEELVDMDSWPLNAIFPNLTASAKFNNVTYGLPQDAEARPLFAWIPHLKAIGWSDADIASLPDRIGKGQYTLYDMLADAKKMQDKGVVAPGYGFYPRNLNGPDFWQFYIAFGGQMFDPKSAKLVFDQAAMTKFYKFFADAVAMGVTKKNHIGVPTDQWYADVASGKAGFWHGGTWHYARYTGKEKLKDFFGTVQFALIPAGEKGGKPTTLTHPLVYLITKQGSDDDANIAAQLVTIASEPRLNVLHAVSSAHLAISEAETRIPLYADNRWASEATKRLLPSAVSLPNDAKLGTYWDIMWNGLLAAWTGDKTPEAAARDAAAEAKSRLGDAIVVR
jgi:inositol-phosphate transport system substrate-binding protein